MKVKINTSGIILIMFLFTGLIISFWLNQIFSGFGFASILISSVTYIWTKAKKIPKRITRINQLIKVAFISIITLSFIVLSVKTILSMFLGNIWGMMIFQYGNNVFKAVMICLSCIGLVTAFLNIRVYQKLK